MAHGLGATRDGGLDGFAERLAAEGLDVLAFDYRGFADSGGGPRQDVDPARQREDYRSAIAHARTIPGVDPDRIVVWGCSFAGGHVLRVAAEDPRVAAVVSLTPAGDGMAVMRKLLAEDGVGAALRLTALGIRDLLAAIRGRDPVTAPLVARPGEVAAITAPGALERYTALAGPSWRNVVAGRIFLRIGAYRPIRKAAAIDGALLVQVADEDTVAPPAAQTAAGVRGRAQVHHYPCDHFDVYPGQPWFDAIVEHQIAFLRRALAVA
ncbi:MAG: alpha/beta hydrolase [Solirubrobacteraceae bacterium]|nr:alpha/beta hydrolase [Solirubrobacteraceae bacterium]